ncbi:MAG: archease [Planctomycetota bacterium]|jgi:tRNA nucleotidyltransferase (CCA-adding enzyme)
MWEHFHHQADIGIRGVGDTLAAAFEEGAIALAAVICDPSKVKAAESIAIECHADESDLLFADWINALIYEIDIRKMLFSRFEVQIEGGKLTARAWGESANPEKHDIAVEVKAATFMELKIFQDDSGQWVAQCVVDV